VSVILRRKLKHPDTLLAKKTSLTEVQLPLRPANQPYQSVQHIFEAQVKKNPANIALIYQDHGLSYQLLNQKANQLARWLIQNGLQKEDLVCIYSEKCMEAVIVLLATLKAQGAYLPVSDKLPPAQLDYILANAKPKFLFNNHNSASGLDALSETIQKDVQIYSYEQLSSELAILDDTNLDIAYDMRNLAYVIYTSGSTGTPKGVAVEQEGIIRLVVNPHYLKIFSSDRVAWMSNIAFDGSTFEVFGALLNGATLVIIPENIFADIALYRKYLYDYKISILLLVTSLFNSLYSRDNKIFSKLKALLIGGEALNPSLIMNLFHSKYSPGAIFNVYGPTEGTTFTTTYQINEEDDLTQSIPIGKPLNNCEVYVLDQDMKPIPDNKVGELYISGSNLARGYVSNPELTAEKFTPNPFSTAIGSRLYRTGDLARKLPSGNLEFMGRRSKDEQVKIRGYRVEIGAIEAQFFKLDYLAQAAVIAKQSPTLGMYLVAFIVSKEACFINLEPIKKSLRHELPEYMMPSFYAILESMPFTNNGKIDKAKLHTYPESMFVQNKERFPLETQAEKKIASMFSALLDVATIYADDDFFELGSHSLLILRLLSELEEAFNVRLSSTDIHEARTVRGIADVVQKKLYQVPGNALIKLKEGDENSIIFFFPPITGNSFCYLKLAEEFQNKHTIYGLQDPTIEDPEIIFDTIDEMAEYYFTLIKSIQRKGPYILMGASFGATFVIEVARLFQQNNEDLLFLGIIDGWATLSRDILTHKIYKNTPQFLEQYLPVEFLHTYQKELMLHRLELLLKHQYKPINLNYTLFKAETVLPTYQNFNLIYNGWEQYCLQPIQLLTIPGDHDTMLKGKNATILTHQIGKCINEAENLYSQL
jgi:amino acid adenylation domain-containing protein